MTLPPVSLDTTPALTRAIQALQRGIMRSKPSADNGDYAIVGFLTINEAEAILSTLATSSPLAPQEGLESLLREFEAWRDVEIRERADHPAVDVLRVAISAIKSKIAANVLGDALRQSAPVAPAVPDHAGLVKLIDAAYQETRTVFADVGGDTSPYHAAGQAADYMRESLLAALRPTGGETP